MASKTVVYNNTNLTQEQIDSCNYLGLTINNWRQRDIVLREHPTDPERLITVGTTFDGKMVVIADEARKDWQTALDYAAKQKVYVRD